MQAFWWTMGVSILFTTALTVCSLNPVTTVVMQGMLYIMSGMLLSLSSVAVDVNLEALLQEPLCDISCESIMHMMTARMCSPPVLTTSDVNGFDHVLLYFSNMFTLSSCSSMYDVVWIMVLMCTFFALCMQYHHPTHCRSLSSFVAFVLCIGSPMDRALVAFAAYWLPAFPGSANESDGVSIASSRDDGDISVDWDFDVQMATALSLSANDGDNVASMEDPELEAALELSRTANPRDSVRSMPGALQNLPEYIVVHSLAPNGWCFYDSVLKHLYPDGQDGTQGEQVTTAMLAGTLTLEPFVYL